MLENFSHDPANGQSDTVEDITVLAEVTKHWWQSPWIQWHLLCTL